MIRAWFDGLCEPKNPGGHAAYGYILKRDGNTVAEGHGYVGHGEGMTNNVAEYTGLIEVLKICQKETEEGEKVIVYGDSQLAIRQMTGVYRVKSRRIRPLWQRAQDTAKFLDVDFKWVPREHNEEADYLSRQAYYEHGDPPRKRRAMNTEMDIQHVRGNLWKVWNYDVDMDAGTCTCPDFQKQTSVESRTYGRRRA